MFFGSKITKITLLGPIQVATNMIIIGPSFLKLNSDDFPFFKTFLAPVEAEIGFWKNIRFFCESDSLGLVYPNSTQTFEDLYSLTKLEKVTSSFIRGLYFHKMGTMTGMFSFLDALASLESVLSLLPSFLPSGFFGITIYEISNENISTCLKISKLADQKDKKTKRQKDKETKRQNYKKTEDGRQKTKDKKILK